MTDRRVKRTNKRSGGDIAGLIKKALCRLDIFSMRPLRLRFKKTYKTDDGINVSIIRYYPKVKFAQVIDLRVHATERQLYLWFADGKSGYWDMSDIDPEPYARWNDETFANWKVDAGMPCYGEDRHYSPDWAAKELVRMPYHKWLMPQETEDDTDEIAL